MTNLKQRTYVYCRTCGAYIGIEPSWEPDAGTGALGGWICPKCGSDKFHTSMKKPGGSALV